MEEIGREWEHENIDQVREEGEGEGDKRGIIGDDNDNWGIKWRRGENRNLFEGYFIITILGWK